jgi:oxygen-independent coproporphyrinogen-3 oxidase
VERVALAGVQHLSAYTLTIEPGTRFGAEHRKGRLPLLEEDQVARSFELVDARLSELGFVHYEISNFARPGYESGHNSGYWLGLPYLGLGLGAWGTLPSPPGALRYRNTVVPERYLSTKHWPEPGEAVTGSGLAYQAFERLSPETLASERLMLGLRLEKGISVAQTERELGVSLLTKERERIFARLIARDRLRLEGDRLFIPKSAWLLADGTIAELL